MRLSFDGSIRRQNPFLFWHFLISIANIYYKVELLYFININMNEYEDARNKYQSLIESHNQTMLRAISVTDNTLREILQGECLDLQEKLMISEKICESLEFKYIKVLGDIMLRDFIDFYTYHFQLDTLYNILKMQGIDLQSITNKLRMRPINCLNQKRELSILMNELHRQLKIVDYQGIVIDILGKYTDESPLIVRCKGFVGLKYSLLDCISLKS